MNENSIFNLIYNNRKIVFDALLQTLKTTPNFQVINMEPTVFIVHAVIGKTLFNPGEPLNISLVELDENKTKINFSTNTKGGAADNLRAKYGDTIQKLIDKMNAILPPPVMEEAPKPNNMVQVGELSRQMEIANNQGVNNEPTSLNQVMSEEKPVTQPVTDNKEESNYKYEPKPFDYSSLKENESSKHQGNDPLKDLMNNL